MEKSKDVRMPTRKEANLETKFIFDTETLVVHMCSDCRLANGKLEAADIDEDHQKLGEFF